MISPTNSGRAFDKFEGERQVLQSLQIVKQQKRESEEGREIAVIEFELRQVEGSGVKGEKQN